MKDVTIEQAKNINDTDIEAIIKLGLTLTDGRLAQTPAEVRPVVEQVLAADHQVLLLARYQDTIVGMATLSLLVGPVSGRKIYLDDFVTDPSVQGKGVGSKLWQAMLDWGREHGATQLTFTSNSQRQAAHRFYLHKGATIYDTCVFKKQL